MASPHCALPPTAPDPFRRLPTEILHLILRAYVHGDAYERVVDDDPFWTPPSPWTLPIVCRTWRAVALSYPDLWTDVVVPLNYYGFTAERVEVQLARSASKPLTVLISDENWLCDPNAVIESLKAVVSQSHRWREARLALGDPAYRPLLAAVRGRLGILERLQLYNSPPHFAAESPLYLAPSLQHVAFPRHGFAHKSPFPLGNLISLRVCWDTYGPATIAALALCSSLHTLTLVGIPSAFLADQLVLPALRVLHLENPQFLDYFGAPPIHTLLVRLVNPGPSGIPLPTVTTLHITDFDIIWPAHFERLLQLCPNVTSLGVGFGFDRYIVDLYGMLEILSPPRGHALRLTSLSLDIEFRVAAGYPTTRFTGDLRAMLETLSPTSGHALRLASPSLDLALDHPPPSPTLEHCGLLAASLVACRAPDNPLHPASCARLRRFRLTSSRTIAMPTFLRDLELDTVWGIYSSDSRDEFSCALRLGRGMEPGVID
ncbi:hypothetical protein B0H15DRAFT_803273 [Mycena belliarum]|uniref:F-box domain-containing protein n=1 Tax=Mycena belliarum TaxID=1033014 RepID=A0AAD6U191_9AGAR|nr:hypothetical protein B0H15DRAFT_803273 [Mycena belliae]